MNYTLISSPHTPINTIPKEMSVLFSTVITLNTDKPILGPDTEKGWATVTHINRTRGQRTSRREQISKTGVLGLNSPCFLKEVPISSLWRFPGEICPVRLFKNFSQAPRF